MKMKNWKANDMQEVIGREAFKLYEDVIFSLVYEGRDYEYSGTTDIFADKNSIEVMNNKTEKEILYQLEKFVEENEVYIIAFNFLYEQNWNDHHGEYHQVGEAFKEKNKDLLAKELEKEIIKKTKEYIHHDFY